MHFAERESKLRFMETLDRRFAHDQSPFVVVRLNTRPPTVITVVIDSVTAGKKQPKNVSFVVYPQGLEGAPKSSRYTRKMSLGAGTEVVL